VRLGFIISRAAAVDETWTTVALAVAALQAGHQVRVMERGDLEVDGRGRLVARGFVFEDPGARAEHIADSLRGGWADRRFVDVERLDVVLLRSAPMTADLISFAQMLKDRGVRVVNDPDGLGRVSSKAWLASLPDVPTPPTVVTRSLVAATQFYRQQRRGCVIKPSRGSGGRGVVYVPPGQRNRLDEAFEICARWDAPVVVQAYLEAAADGEKRLLWLDGQIIGGYLRSRAPGEFRHNLKCGGSASGSEVIDEEKSLLQPLAPHLIRLGIRFAGLDLIGKHLIEVNAVNPGGTFHADRLSGTTHAQTVVQRLLSFSPRITTLESSTWALHDH
jgi:glutathione synthase